MELIRQLTALAAGKVSKVSTKMVELSLQHTQRNPTLADMVPQELEPVASSLLLSTNVVPCIGRLHTLRVRL
jgi:hypothetical protein